VAGLKGGLRTSVGQGLSAAGSDQPRDMAHHDVGSGGGQAPALRIRDLVKSYDGVSRAVDGISIDIARGELVTFLGPSGSGKTTTLLMIAGFEDPTDGAIELEGRDLTRVKPYHRNIGIVFQSYALFPHMTVARNVGFPLRMRGRARGEIDARVARVLELVGLGALADRHPRQLSGGQQQRVALARALVFEPSVLLLDEPLGALDKSLREQLQVEIKRIQRALRVTTIYVTHDQTEAMTLSDRIVVFNRGAIEQAGPPLEIYDRPATRFVGAFVGDSNFFTGTVVDAAARRVHLDTLDLTITVPTPVGNEGQTLTCLIRPERVRLVQSRDVAGHVTVVELEVEGRVNYGESVLIVGTAKGQPLRVRVPGGDAGTIREGTKLLVGWTPADVHLIPTR
jgi:putative spermidine/putrescine transport system ATP-binding protein